MNWIWLVGSLSTFSTGMGTTCNLQLPQGCTEVWGAPAFAGPPWQGWELPFLTSERSQNTGPYNGESAKFTQTLGA